MPLVNVPVSSGIKHAISVLDYDNNLCVIAKKYIVDKKNSLIFNSFFNEQINLDKIFNLSQGGHDSVRDYLPFYLEEKYSKSKNVVIFFDDVMANPKDYIVLDIGINSLSLNGEFYRYIYSNDLESDLLRKLIWCVSVSWHFVCVVIDSKEVLPDSMEKMITDSNFEGCDILEVIVGAFDGEGYLHISHE